MFFGVGNTIEIVKKGAFAPFFLRILIERLPMMSHIWCQKKWPAKSCNLCWIDIG